MALFETIKSYAHKRSEKASGNGGPEPQKALADNPGNQSLVHAPGSDVGLPNTHDWSNGYPTTTYMDAKSGLLTACTAGAGEVPDDMTVYTLYEGRAKRAPDSPMLHFRQDGEWVYRTGSEVLNDIRTAAKGLIHSGLKKGDTVAFMCQTSYEWDIVDAAVLSIGGVIATIYDTDSAEQIRLIVDNSDARLLIVQTKAMREKADGAIEECPSLERIACLETGALQELQAYGNSVSDEELDERIRSVKKTDLCSIVYTSGSTAAPKGVEMTHEHYCTLARNLTSFIPNLTDDPDGSILLFLPQAHTFARAISYGVISASMQVYISQGLNNLLSDLQESKPTVVIGVPRVFEKIYNAATQKAGHGPKGVVFAQAACAARDYMSDVAKRGKPTRKDALRRAAFDPLVYSSLREVLGGRAKWIVSGGAPLDHSLLSFFRGAKIPVYEGYGLTETTAPCAFSPLGTPYRQGSVGIPFPGFSIRIAQDGEIQVKGTCVFHRYHKNPQATAGVFTADGWYGTGDLGRLSNDGFLYITGRKKDLIITAGGKNVSPRPIEEIIERSPIVSQALILGDKRPFISALVTLDEEALRSWLSSEGLGSDMSMEEAASNAAVRAEVEEYVDKANEGVSRAESVRKFIILPEEFSQENGLMTPSMKVIRPKVLERYADLLRTRMYTPKKPKNTKK
ncbi:long-chain-fatty-acid-CoA ligase [Bifidobacterium actinocoloniiforme DSM 22766]|uniref:Acyl-CoA synthetase n=1 Tax=Bifidobacterium actinocoloniiforme DSM 22766 TaxID=1437605 RepID=A0A086Z0A2_9BIFI|nr:AMP-dependent synthetase/ligase [Bifidobacterium actinocoloniiforme]AKV55205.1 AMP-binding protein [Bifidobacterium actinocoloniiforme DSM 22766]KFI39952.1 long-chain-fatty-acid-CoA ligase [Bifidobacterium actinocoloniiforme DSM 22766]